MKDGRAMRWQKSAGLARAWIIAHRPDVWRKICAVVEKKYPLKDPIQRAKGVLRKAGI